VDLDAYNYADETDLASLDGTLVVLDYFDNGYPRQLGIAIEPTADTFWRIEDKEYIWLMEGSLSRQLIPHVGRDVRLHGVIRDGHSFLRAIALRSYEFPEEIVALAESRVVVVDKFIEGTVVVLERHQTGQPTLLGISTDECAPVALADTNKSRELMYRIGRRMRVDGALDANRVLTVTAYAEIDGNPLVQAGDGFQLSFLAGGLDESGQFMGGVEVDALKAFDGKIFAGTSYSENTQQESPDPVPPGSQILVLDRADGRWRVDFVVPDNTNGSKSKMKFLDVVQFETDYTGAPLNPPVEMLAAASGNGDIYLRFAGDESEWLATDVDNVVRAAADPGRKPDSRSLVSHTDTVTGVSYLFAGVGIGRRSGVGGGIYRGAYDPGQPGLIRWEATAELPIADGPRPMGLSEINGYVYASVGPRLLRRIDGDDPGWEEVLFYLNPFRADSVRRASEISSPQGGSSILVGIENVAGAVVRIDPDEGDKATEEFSVSEQIPGSSYTIVAYNGPAVRKLEEGEELAVLGIEINRVRTTLEPSAASFDFGRYYEFTDGLFLVRLSENDYRLQRIRDPAIEVPPPLVAPRTVLMQSPFPGEEHVIYIGGFDHNGNLSHNSGWIYKVHLDDVLSGAEPLPLQHCAASDE
jgi:hypothetical protein